MWVSETFADFALVVTMFFLKSLKRDILLEPRMLGPNMVAEVKGKLVAELEGQCLGKHGYVVSIFSIEDKNILPGMIDNDTGSVHVTVKYGVILLRPFRNEIMDAVVTLASDENGFFARVGPLQIFVSRHNMPDEIQFNPLTENWASDDREIEIVSGSLVRLRIIGLSFDAAGISAVGTINEAFLGQIS